MKSLMPVLVFVICIFTLGVVYAQDYPEVSQDDENITLTIPYLEFEDEEGETRAYSAELFAPKDGGEIRFFVDDEELLEVDLDNPAGIEGEGACSRTTDAQLHACRAEASDDYFIEIAICFNEPDQALQEACMTQVSEDRSDTLDDCEEMEESHAMLCEVLGEDPYDPDFNPDDFLTLSGIIASPNPYFPLIPGNTWIYEVEEETITVEVLFETREIMGVTAVVVRDVVEEDGELVEDTQDWFAQDEVGNVWYMGEISINYEDGELSDVEGSWEAGVDGAKPGILFRAMPIIDEVYRQEYLIGEAEDVGKTIDLGADESTDAGFDCNGNCLLTQEWNPLEPEVLEEKYYLPGTGKILSIDLEEDAREELVSFTPGN